MKTEVNNKPHVAFSDVCRLFLSNTFFVRYFTYIKLELQFSSIPYLKIEPRVLYDQIR